MRGLAAHGLVKSYRRRRVVDDVCLTIDRGEVVGLLGPNGAGKTTTFYLLVGLIHPDTGVVNLDGVDITGVPLYQRARAGIGYLPQESSNSSLCQNTSAKKRRPNSWTSSGLAATANGSPRRCPVGNGAGSKSPVPWQHRRPFCCWTSPSPGSIQL